MKTIVLIHGWDNNNYSSKGGQDAWANRIDFVHELSKSYKVLRLNLPGFCGEPEPAKEWDLSNFSDFFQDYIISNNILPDAVLGYSFGAAVALKWKLKFKNNCKLFLVSPAISRAYSRDGIVQKISFLKALVPSFVTRKVRDIYLKKIGNRFYIEGTSFLRNTYLNIVKVDLSSELTKLNANDVVLIFGSDDTATPYSVLRSKIIDSEIVGKVKIIQGGNHNIAQTHFHEIGQIILEHLENSN